MKETQVEISKKKQESKEKSKTKIKNDKYFNNKHGITLIALVVTIVVMLILAGITIQTAIGEGGIINLANETKEQQIIASYKDTIGIVGINWSLNRALDDSVTVDDLWQDMQDSKIINNKETEAQNLSILYQINSIEGTYQTYDDTKGITGLEHGDTVFAVLSDGTNITDYTSIDVLDKLGPTVTVTQESKNTNSIQVNASSSDAEWGMPDSITYNYYIKKTADGNYPQNPTHTGTETSYTFTGLIQNTSYDVKVTTSDKAGNLGSGQVTNITTDTVGGAGDDLKEGNIITSDPTWSNGSASITLSKGTEVASSLIIQYQVGDIAEGNWTTAQEGAASVTVTGLKHNDIVYARLTDGVNNGSHASVIILDKLPPQSAKIKLSETSTTTTGNITATITHIDNESGIELTKCKWVYNTNQNSIGTEESSYINAFRNEQPIILNANIPGTYYLHVLTVDKAGNKIESISQGITVTQLVTGITVNPTSVTLEEGQTLQLTAIVTPSNASNKTVSWSSDNTNVITVSNTGLVIAKAAGKATVTVKAKDGSNKEATCEITVETAGTPIESILKEGDYVEYVDGTGETRDCVVL